MQQLFKRMLSVLLAAAVLLSLTVTAFAADGGADTRPQTGAHRPSATISTRRTRSYPARSRRAATRSPG